MQFDKQSHSKKCHSAHKSNSILSRIKLQQLFSARRSGPFVPTYDSLSSARAFIPSKKALYLQKDKLYKNSKFTKIKNSKKQVCHESSQISKRQSIKICEYASVFIRETVSYIKGKPMLPAKKNYAKKLLQKGALQRYQFQDDECQVIKFQRPQRPKNMKLVVPREKRSKFWGRTEVEEGPIAGWNFHYLRDQPQTSIL